MNQEFQPHEAHVPFNLQVNLIHSHSLRRYRCQLQFFIDNNLYGMNFILFNTGSQRQATPMSSRNRRDLLY